MVGSGRDYRDVYRVLRTGLCWIGERVTANESANDPERRAQAVLRARRMGNSSAVRQVHRPGTDYRLPDGNYWALVLLREN